MGIRLFLIDLIGHRHLSTLPNHAPTRLPQTHPFAMIANRFGGAQLPRPCGSVSRRLPSLTASWSGWKTL
jgi:hypothetical protein